MYSLRDFLDAEMYYDLEVDLTQYLVDKSRLNIESEDDRCYIPIFPH